MMFRRHKNREPSSEGSELPVIRTQSEVFDELGPALSLVLPEGFERFWLRVEMAPTSGAVSPWVTIQGAPFEVYQLLPTPKLIELLRELWLGMRAEGAEWEEATFTVDSDGRFNVEYAYPDTAGDETDWIARHLPAGYRSLGLYPG